MDTEYASKGVAGSGLGLGIAGTALGLLNAHGGFGGLFGGGRMSGVAGMANDAVILDIARKDAEIAQLKADAATDKKLVEVYSELRRQDKAQDGVIADINTRLTAVETSAPLRERIVLGRVDEVARTATCGIAANSAAIDALRHTVGHITRTIVPKDVICPEYMTRYNSWTAPVAASADAPAQAA